MARIGLTLKRLRRGRGLSQAALAQKAKVTGAYITQLETGVRNNPSIAVAKRLATALGVHLTELLGMTKGHAGRQEEEGVR